MIYFHYKFRTWFLFSYIQQSKLNSIQLAFQVKASTGLYHKIESRIFNGILMFISRRFRKKILSLFNW